ncbi:MAG: tryptophan synthase subunit alpha [Clostridiales bacterium]|nr:tryptophan synthase subunit alpha [Clostridiales bacterium]
MINISQQFEESKLIIPYIMVGDGGLEQSCALLELYVQSGCKVIEIGVPFSDPAADGETIQLAAIRALKKNITLTDCLTFIQSGKEKYPDISFILMTYINPIIHYGINDFFNDSLADGIIVPDMPLEEYDILYQQAKSSNTAIVPLIAIDTDFSRMKNILEKSDGFVYVITLKGITGTQDATITQSEDAVKKLRYLTNLPLVAGFGIKTSQQINTFHNTFDGVVIASQLIKHIQNEEYGELERLLNTKKTVI